MVKSESDKIKVQLSETFKLWLEEENTVYNIYNKTTLMVNGMHLYGASLP